MKYGNNDREKYSYGVVSDASYERFRDRMDLQGPSPGSEPSLAEIRTEVGAVPTEEFAEMGESIRADLEEPLNAELLEEALDHLAEAFDDFEDLRENGVPRKGETPYADLTDAAWVVDEHLSETGFFEAAEAHSPRFTPEYIADTTRQLVTIDSLGENLAELGFPEDEQAALVTNIVNSSDRLSWWGKAEDYPTADSQEEWSENVVPEFVSPLQKRASSGSLLWIDGLDWRIWQYEFIITEESIVKGVWDVKSMLAGVYLMGDAALKLARDEVTDEDLATLVTASTAVMLIGQELVADDVARLDVDQRIPIEEMDFENMNFEA